MCDELNSFDTNDPRRPNLLLFWLTTYHNSMKIQNKLFNEELCFSGLVGASYSVLLSTMGEVGARILVSILSFGDSRGDDKVFIRL